MDKQDVVNKIMRLTKTLYEDGDIDVRCECCSNNTHLIYDVVMELNELKDEIIRMTPEEWSVDIITPSSLKLEHVNVHGGVNILNLYN